MKTNLLVLVNENLVNAETALRHASDETVVQLCRDYLQLLSKYRDGLYTLRGTPEISVHQTSLLARELVLQTRKAIRRSIETTVKEVNAAEALLKSLTCISGYEAAATFNQLGYRGFYNWEIKAGRIGSPDNTGEQYLSTQEAVAAAGSLRCAAYVNDKTIF